MAVLLLPAEMIIAQSTDKAELEEQIQTQNKKIERINQEINQYESELESTKTKKRTLEEAVQSLNQSINSLTQRVATAEDRIDSVQGQIQTLEQEIATVQSDLESTKSSLSNSIRMMHALDSRSLAELLLSAKSLSAAWKTSDQLAQLQSGLQAEIKQAKSLKKKLETKKTEAKSKKSELNNLRSRLSSQQTVLSQQQTRKNQLLNQTSQQAKEYQQILAEKRAQKEEFERRLQAFEEQLETTVSDDAIPTANEASFAWPVSSINITQQFGGTAFANRNPDAYGRPFHNGTDFGVPTGTPINPVQSGVVQATGNTDRINGCYSYGKWVLIDHNNGLATLYAHLSNINASAGQSVTEKSVLGYSGNTGYSTGPHLHLTTYVSSDVQIRRLGDVKDQTNCGPAEIPVAPQAGYLNPVKYLPKL